MTKRTPIASRTPTAEVEQAVLDAADRLVATDGPGALNIRTLAKDAGVAPMSIYNRFGDKAGVLQALFARGFVRLHDHLAADPPTAPDADAGQALASLRRAAETYRAFAKAYPGTYALMFEAPTDLFEPDQTCMDQAANAFLALLEKVEQAQRAGAVVGGNPAEIAQRVWASIHGSVALEMRGIVFFDDADVHFAALLDTLFAGLSPSAGVPGIDGPLVRPRSGDVIAVPR